jgi:Na+/proline symporter
MTAVFAAAFYSLKAVATKLTDGADDSVFTGLKLMVEKLKGQEVLMVNDSPVMSAASGAGQPILDILPNFSMSELALMIFILPMAISWWANWYPGAEPGGGSYIAQRMLASKSEKDSLGGTLFFNLAHYVFRPWPWIITALCSIIIFPDLASIQAAFPDADASRIGHDSAFPAMLKFLPVGFVGLMVGGLIAANSSTILTHLNWGSSYLVHDFYRRFITKSASESHYINVGRLCTVGLYLVAAVLSLYMASAQQAFQVLLSIGAGTGLIYVARWFWWRVSAWSEVVAMVMSLLTAYFVPKYMEGGFAEHTITQVAITTIAWIVASFLLPPTDKATLISFVRKVKPAGPGWAAIRAEAGVSDADVAGSNHTVLAFVGWAAGVATIWSSLFAIGNFLYAAGDASRWTMAWVLTAVFIVSGLILLNVIQRLWAKPVTA